MSAIDFHHIRLAWSARRDAPWWWRAVEWLLRIVIAGYFIGVLIMGSVTAAQAYHRLPVALHPSVARLAAGVAVLVGIAFFAVTARFELYQSRDIAFLVTTPLHDRQRFHRKLRAVVKRGLGVAAIGMVLSFAFAFRLLLPLRTYAGLLAGIVFMTAMMVAGGLLLALHDALRAAYMLVCRWLIYAAFVATIAFVVKLPSSIETVDSFLATPRSLAGAWWPGAIAADLARGAAFHDNAMMLIAAAKLMVMIAVVYALAEALVETRYTVTHVLNTQTDLFVTKDRDVRRLETPRSDDALARWIRTGVSPRRFALLQLLQRREAPDAVWPRLRSLLLSIAFIIFSSYVWRAAALSIGLNELGANVGFMFILPVWFTALTRELTHQPSEAAYAFIRGAQIARASSRGIMQRTLLPDRGNHNHPLVESWPVSLREFARLRAANDVITSAVFVAIMLVAVALTPFPFVITGSVTLALGFLILISVLDGPARHAASYRTDLRRRRVYILLRLLLLLGYAFIGTVLLAGVLMGLFFVARRAGTLMLTVGLGAFAFAIFLVAAVWFGWRRMERHDREHRFDAEYSPVRAAHPFGRW